MKETEEVKEVSKFQGAEIAIAVGENMRVMKEGNVLTIVQRMRITVDGGWILLIQIKVFLSEMVYGVVLLAGKGW